ncbi:MAG: UDP-N-acetylmuramate dehydrogenase [Phycisphaerales bacterium]|nr:UDP-N-acetylmuramate dehydrogenase [Phycisphaerales bacterium]
MTATDELTITRDAEIGTWFGIGGRADRLARPANEGQLRACLQIDPGLRVLGEGANLLVDDDGVRSLVVRLDDESWRRVEFDAPSGVVRARAGADLPRLILDCARRGLAGLEGLGGIPASVGGAVVMNAGGRFGEIGGAIASVRAMSREGREVLLRRESCRFGYRSSALSDLIVLEAEFQLTPADPGDVRERLKEVMAYKKTSQPMGDRSAGCCFKNPMLRAPVPDVGDAGQRVPAGMLIDRAGCKGLAIGGARVSERHANFIVTSPGARARDVIALMRELQRRVADAFGVRIEPEVAIWRRDGIGLPVEGDDPRAGWPVARAAPGAGSRMEIKP